MMVKGTDRIDHEKETGVQIVDLSIIIVDTVRLIMMPLMMLVADHGG